VDRIEFKCPACRASVLAPASLAGECAQCPKCAVEIDSWPTPRHPRFKTPQPIHWTNALPIFAFVALLLTGGTFATRLLGGGLPTASTSPPASDTSEQTLVGWIDQVSMHSDDFLRGIPGFAPLEPDKFDPNKIRAIVILKLMDGTTVICLFTPGENSATMDWMLRQKRGDKLTVHGHLHGNDKFGRNEVVYLYDCSTTSR